MLGEDLYDIMTAKLDFIDIALMLPSRSLVLDIHRNEWHAQQQAPTRGDFLLFGLLCQLSEL